MGLASRLPTPCGRDAYQTFSAVHRQRQLLNRRVRLMADWGAPGTVYFNSTSVTQTMWSVGTFPTVSGATLDSISVYSFAGEASTPIRMAIYTGGISDSNPFGATLIYDTGSRTTGSATEGFKTLAATGSPALPSGARLWIASRAYSWPYGRTGNPTNFSGRVTATDETGSGNPASAFPSVVDNTTQTAGAGTPFMFYLTYSTASGGSSIVVISSGFHVRNINR